MVTIRTNSPERLDQFAQVICRAIATLQQQQPEWLLEKIRPHDWQKAERQAECVKKLQAFLDQPTSQEPGQMIRSLLQRLFVPEFFETSAFEQLQTQLHQLDLRENSSPELLTTPQPQSELNGKVAEPNRAIALLLLDAENLKLDSTQELFLRNICTFPLQVKIAFANWKACGKYDEELHRRGYDLMHVPAGNDMADGKMIAIGSSIHDHYSGVQEVLVCSSDKVMTNLHTKLSQQGLTVYQVRKQQDGAIAVTNSNTEQTLTCPKVETPIIPPLETSIAQLKEVIRTEQQRSGNHWIELSKISQLFRNQYQFSLSQLVNIHQPGKRARDLFLERPQEFVVHQAPEKAALYITLFEAGTSINPGTVKVQNPVELAKKEEAASSPSSNNGKGAQANQAAAEFSIKTAKDLETAIAQIISSLTGDSEGFVDISAIGSQFRQHYQRPITQVIKQLNINKKYPTFLQSCPTLVVQKKDGKWQVRIKSARL